MSWDIGNKQTYNFVAINIRLYQTYLYIIHSDIVASVFFPSNQINIAYAFNRKINSINMCIGLPSIFSNIIINSLANNYLMRFSFFLLLFLFIFFIEQSRKETIFIERKKKYHIHNNFIQGFFTHKFFIVVIIIRDKENNFLVVIYTRK